MNRIYYIDNLRIFLIVLVVLHHLAITYGGPGGWDYVENEPDTLSAILYSMFLASNQSFFMGLFFLISAYFTAHVIERKKTGKFISDRLKRLVIPLLVYYFIISPVVVFMVVRWHYNDMISFKDFIIERHGFGFGPMWFVEALIYFTGIYLIYYYIFERKRSRKLRTLKLPGNGMILLFALLIGAAAFVIRIWLPVGWEFRPLGFQFPYFLQYIFMFAMGIFVYKRGWLESLTYKKGIGWFVFAQVCIFILFPLMFLFGGGSSGNLDPFLGGVHWQSLAYAVWEQVTGFSLIIGLMGIFKQKWNAQGKLMQIASKSTYTVFIIHPLVLVALALSLRNIQIYPLLKYVAVAPIAVISCFVLATIIREMPLAKKIL